MRYAIRGGNLITPRGIIPNQQLIIENNKIATILNKQDDIVISEVVDAEGLFIAPGYIDIHVHGAGGKDLTVDGIAALPIMSNELARHGVTSFCPTSMAFSLQEGKALLAEYRSRRPTCEGAQPLGLHLEGPYLNPLYPGGNDTSLLRHPDPHEYRSWRSDSVRLVTIAPELPGALACIRTLTGRDINCALGHSQCRYERALAAQSAGANQTTHLFNCMTGLHHRQPGLAGATLLNEGISAQLICDPHLLHPTVVRMVVELKGWQGIILVSDAEAACGLRDGEHSLHGRITHIKNGIAYRSDGSFAYSTLTLDQAVRNLVQYTGLPLWQAALAASYNPSNTLGLYPHKGSLMPGVDADLILLDEGGNLQKTIIAGKIYEY